MNGRVHRRNGLSIVSALVATVLAGASTHSEEAKVDGRLFVVSNGFTIEKIAGPPLVDRPITAAFDREGRLYVADSSGSNADVKTQLAEKPHRIIRLEDCDGDGKFDHRTVFADKMMFPEGTMWYGGSLYVSAPPSIWKLTDTNGDGVADQRHEWFAGKTLTGCANDLHGPYPGPDGWIYWCKGAFAPQTYDRPGKPPFVTRAAHIFRARPDGKEIEPVMTGGMDNPVDVVFTPGGERIFTTTFLVNPSGGQRDGLIHAIYGGIYGKVHDQIFDASHHWTGPEVMPVLLHMGPAAPCGLTRYESDVFGKAFQNNLFACYFNLHKVSRHVLTPRGPTFTTSDEDFVSSPDLDFHPTDVIEDADGSLLIVDTGGWYKLCCPTSQLQKPDVLGAIYRVRRRGAPEVADARGLEIKKRLGKIETAAALEEMVNLLDDPRPAVRLEAIETLSAPANAEAKVEALRAKGTRGPTTLCRQNIVWTLARINLPAARDLVRGYLHDPDETVRQAAIHVIGLWRDKDSPALIGLLESSSAQNARAVAEALGRIGASSAVAPLLAAAGRADDRILAHSLIYALIEIGDREATRAGLSSENPRIKTAALVALDQMDGAGVDPKFVAGLLSSSEPELKATATWIVGRHPDWAGALASVLGERLNSAHLSTGDRGELEHQLGRFAMSTPVQRLLAERLSDPSCSIVTRRSCLQAMAWSTFKERDLPPSWIDAIARVFDDAPANADLIAPAVATLRALPISAQAAGQIPQKLCKIAADLGRPKELRLSALAALPGGSADLEENLFAFLIGQLGREQSVAARTTAADVLAKAKLSTAQLERVADALRSAGPLEADRLLGAFDQSTDEALGTKLLDALGAASALASLRVDSLKAHLAKYPQSVHKKAESLYARLNVDSARQKQRLEQLSSALSAGDVRRGQLIFHSDKAACYSCHAIGYRGGNVGPDLTRIGSVRAERDLLEAIVFPSASLVRSFEPVIVATTDGKVTNGLIRGETADLLILATGANQEARIARSDIEELRPSTVSVMPAGLDQQLSPSELADLVAFLKACR
jgi:putative membrane-bound dehydrogenase-like protein